MNLADTALDKSTAGFRSLRVMSKVRESSIITSFYLEPAEPAGWRDFKPGQFLVFRIPDDAGADQVLRNYSLSCAPGMPGKYRITVKREPAPAADLPEGHASCFLHDRVDEGDTLTAEGPRGDFTLNRDSMRPVVLLSGGVGLTPLVSMLHDLARGSDRRVHFIHACENGDVHALRQEVSDLCSTRQGLFPHFIYRTPTAQDRATAQHHSEGLASKQLLQSLLPLDDYDFYLCGPPPFMQALYGLLRDLGVPKDRIAYEFFGPATVLEPDVEPATAVPAALSEPAPALGSTMVEFRTSGIIAAWDETAQSLLSFAEDQGLAPAFSCRAGICGTCKSRLVSGSVHYFEEPLDDLASEEVLLCCSKPQGSIVLDI